MEHRIDFLDEINCVAIKILGEPTFNEVQRDLRRLLNHPQYRPGIDMLVDCRETEYKQLSASTIRDLARAFTKDATANRPGNLALVVRGKLGFGLARMWEFLVNVDVPVQVFKSMEEAREWLGLRDVQFRFDGSGE